MDNKISIVSSKFLSMKKKLFNYFLKKAMQKEQAVLKSGNPGLAALGIIFSKLPIIVPNPNGARVETRYVFIPRYAEELFLILCMDATAHGDNLLQVFNFKSSMTYIRGYKLQDMKDNELIEYLEQAVYPIAIKLEEEMPLYTKLFSLPPKETKALLQRLSVFYVRKVNIEKLKNQPEPCAETEMIDRAWNRLMHDKNFIVLFDCCCKHLLNGYSNAYEMYSTSPLFQK